MQRSERRESHTIGPILTDCPLIEDAPGRWYCPICDPLKLRPERLKTRRTCPGLPNLEPTPAALEKAAADCQHNNQRAPTHTEPRGGCGRAAWPLATLDIPAAVELFDLLVDEGQDAAADELGRLLMRS